MFYFLSLTRQDKIIRSTLTRKLAIKLMHNYVLEEETVNIKIILTVKPPYSLLTPVFITKKLYFNVIFCKMVIL